MTRRFFIFTLIFSLFFLTSSKVNAAENQTHFTLIVNQVRGNECCDVGSVEIFAKQLQFLQTQELVASFALRYDVLSDQSFTKIILADQTNEYGALLEITPQMAKAAQVTYKTQADKWYEAQNAYLIGYTQKERQKIIDTYMSKYREILGKYPKFSSAWMIDPWSLKYLKEKFGVIAHQITREQFGTDSYTLYGGPVHYPYYPSSNWALIPEQTSESKKQQLPMIFRQTISDPVFNYGDRSNSFTSQPNDYFLRGDNISYFRHLFGQAHQQQNSYTFAVIGLENSMTEKVNHEFELQLNEVGKWQSENNQNKVAAVSEFEEWFTNNQSGQMTVYEGVSAKNLSEKSWWINTEKYRARLRLSGGELSVTDLRVYSTDFTDPYLETPAKSLGWWIVPYVLDGSRIVQKNLDGQEVTGDGSSSVSRKLVLAKQVKEVSLKRSDDTLTLAANSKETISFDSQGFRFAQTPDFSLLKKDTPFENLSWIDAQGKQFWGFSKNGEKWSPTISITNLDQVRTEFSSLLFPEKKFAKLDADKTTLFINNDYAVVGRNPIRLVFFPKDDLSQAVLLSGYPRVNAEPAVTDISLFEQHQNNGMIFMDVKSDQSQHSKITVEYDGFQKKIDVYFAPNCKEKKFYCVTHPRQAWWYFKSYLADRARAKEEARQKKEMFGE